jgi:hypothetical protein
MAFKETSRVALSIVLINEIILLDETRCPVMN